jgi:serine/threonine-protein kinase
VVERSGEEYDDEVPAGHVLTQTPTSGTLHRGDTVRLVVSKGPELVAVPDGLVAMGVEPAEAKLSELGFEVDVQESSSYLGLGFVMEVDPGAGTLLPMGSTVTLYLV